jgi:tetratricopeptide (TPR) repeat protein
MRSLVTRLRTKALRAYYKLVVPLFIVSGSRSPADHYAERSWDHLVSGDLPGAVRWAEASILYDPSLAHGFSMLGNARLRMGDVSSARDAFERGLRLTPNDAWLHCDLGYLEIIEDAPEQASASFRRALDLMPGVHQMMLGLAEALTMLERFDEAIPLFQQALPMLENAREARPGDVESLGFSDMGAGAYTINLVRSRALVAFKRRCYRPDGRLTWPLIIPTTGIGYMTSRTVPSRLRGAGVPINQRFDVRASIRISDGWARFRE